MCVKFYEHGLQIRAIGITYLMDKKNANPKKCALLNIFKGTFINQIVLQTNREKFP